MHDEPYMREALERARLGLGRTSPNPVVGAVVVKDGVVAGRGHHERAGAPHAEVMALDAAGPAVAGGTLYVTLEPCDHHGRTGPCTEAILRAGITRVVAAMRDPDPRVNGRGLERLRATGIAVAEGILEADALRLNEAYVKHRRTGLPFVTLKWAMSADGRLAAQRGARTTLTGSEALHHTHELRDCHDAILVGINTILTDDPQLTCRLAGGRDPLRVVLDSRLRIPSKARVLHLDSRAQTLVVTTEDADPEEVERVRRQQAEVWVLPGSRPSLREALGTLARRGVLSVLIEGGGTVHASAVREGLADYLVVYVAPRLLGGLDAPRPLEGLASQDDGASPLLHLLEASSRRLGDDVLIEGYLPGVQAWREVATRPAPADYAGAAALAAGVHGDR